jgi:hypothetical protein
LFCLLSHPPIITPFGVQRQALLTERLLSSDPSVHRRRTLYLWGRARDLLFRLDRCRGAALLRGIAELISGETATTDADAEAGALLSRPSAIRARTVADRDWMDRLLRGGIRLTEIEDLADAEMTALLLAQIKSGSLRERKKAVSVLAHRRGVSIRTIAGHLSISRVSARKYVRAFANGGSKPSSRAKKGLAADALKTNKYKKPSSRSFMSRRRRAALTEPLGHLLSLGVSGSRLVDGCLVNGVHASVRDRCGDRHMMR